MILISVIIPVFNSVTTLERAVRSVIDSASVLEVIIVDDGSSDGSIELAQDLSRRFEQVMLVQHPNGRNRGGCASRNLGLACSKGSWIQFLDADDEILVDKIAGQIELVSEHSPFVVGNSIHVFPDGRRHFRKADRDVWKGLIRGKLGDTCANLWNRCSLVEVGGWDESLSSSQEYDLMFRLVCINPNVIFDSRFMTLIHKTLNSVSTNLENAKFRNFNWLSLRERIRLYLVDQGIFDLRKKYFWSGAVGNFCREQGAVLPEKVNFFFCKIYYIELQLRRKAYQIISSSR
ncbi:glycosyltransferase family 2 protein [Algoriphagus aestuariicola]|uniref:Glycosyltransferase family 2 protein n=1 Tax=Algoriphagus aestuariicola TaxID=1852016 RepID=A0ABS3BMX3_9BACT|nr:glycosyltransferase family 2 protein [Algoriphagus aestuariicola]MBN7800179.1 glycosyltransferase family 2 protein [Algoriphagus aestuariicola]